MGAVRASRSSRPAARSDGPKETSPRAAPAMLGGPSAALAACALQALLLTLGKSRSVRRAAWAGARRRPLGGARGGGAGSPRGRAGAVRGR